MDEIKMNLEAIRINLGLSRKEIADRLNIGLDRYNRLATGESKMYAEELIMLHEISRIPYNNISINRN